MRKFFFILLFVSLVMNIFALEVFHEEKYLPNIIVVAFDARAINTRVGDINKETNSRGNVQIGLPSFDALANEYGFTNIQRMFGVEDQEWQDENGVYPMNIFRVTVPDNSKMDAALSALSSDSSVIFAEYEAINRIRYIPNDPEYNKQWHLPSISAPDMWNYIRGDTTIVIGIVDSGIKWNHEDLRDNMYIYWPQANGMTINWATGVISGPTGGGYQYGNDSAYGDILGWNFAGTQNNQSYQGFAGNTHGTHVAGLAGAVGDNYIGGTGVAIYTRLLGTRHSPNNQHGQGRVQDPYNGIYYAADRGASVINCSWGGPGSANTANNAVNYARARGAVVVVAAGNDGDNCIYENDPSNMPANAEHAISVAMLNQNDTKNYMSCYGPNLTISAPGTQLFSTYYSGNGANTNDSYAVATGTSMAAPVVSGVVAMMFAVNPHLTVDDVKQRLKDTADPLPEDVPGHAYHGLLGGGKVNAFKAVMCDFIPNLSIWGEPVVVEHEGDGDGIPNIGETIKITISLQNESGWSTATYPTATLSTDIPDINIIEGTLEYSQYIMSGSSADPSNEILVHIGRSVNLLEIPFTLTIKSNQEATNMYPYTKEIPLTINVSMSKPNWPLVLGAESPSSAMVADLDGNGYKMITVSNGIVHVVNSQKVYDEGFPKNIGENTGTEFAIGDVSRNGNQQIVLATTNGKVIVLDHRGNILNEFDAGTNIRVSPIIADLNNDGHNEIIVATQNGNLYVLNGHDLSVWENYPISLGTNITTQMAVGDVNGDGSKNIVVNIMNSGVHVLNPITGQNITGFPYTAHGNTWVGSTLVNLSGGSGLDIIFAGNENTDCPIVIIKNDGTLFRQTTVPFGVRTEIAVMDLRGDGNHLIVFGDTSGNIWVKNVMLEDLPGFPFKVANRIESSPVFADVDVDGVKEIVFGDNDGNLHVVKLDGTSLRGYPLKLTNTPIRRSPWIGSFDPGKGGILVTLSSGVDYIDTKRYALSPAWNTFRGNLGKTASYTDPRTPDIEIHVPVLVNSLEQNFPNPFNPETTIRFSITNNEFVKLSIFNIRGQLVKNLLNQDMLLGQHNVLWNGTDNNGNSVASGLYLYRIETDSFHAVKRMLLMK